MADMELALLVDTLLQSEEDISSTCIQLIANENVIPVISTTVLMKKRRHRKARVTNYVETILPLYRIDDFRDRFRMNRDTFESLVTTLAPFLIHGNQDGNMKTPVEKQLLIFVKYVSTQLTLQTLADIFGVCEATVFNLVKRISSIICCELMPHHIKWPAGYRVQRTINEFQQLKGFPGVLGAIDGSHIPIRTPTKHHENYINRKGFHSIILQAVCDANMHFRDVYCGWPGSVHDSRVLKNSNLFSLACNTDTLFPGNTHLLGDSAYPLQDWLLTPFKDYGNLNASQKRYNYIHSATRMSVERSFGSLKGRFRRLKYIDMMDMERIVNVVLSSCTLHEFCLEHSDSCEEYIQDGARDEEEINNFQYVLGVPVSAELKREHICYVLNE